MPRNISFALTIPQFNDGSKDVTRRFGWWNLKEGDVLMAVEKGMGLKPGEQIKRLGLIRIVSVRCEPLDAITQADVIREGFPDWTPKQFVDFLVKQYAIKSCSKMVNRIEFIRLNEQQPDLIGNIV
jgi:hypothetical protein